MSLVAKDDIGLGQTVAAENLQWQTWTESVSSGSFIRKKDRPEAITEIVGSIARMPFIAGEPIREQKLVKANGSGFMAAILPTGMRAVSTEISAETGAGGFILPNDRVDVILSKREKQQSVDGAGQPPEIISSQTVLTNVRVLAIDQAPKEKEGQNAVLGKTATLEMTPDEVEVLGKARLSGTLVAGVAQHHGQQNGRRCSNRQQQTGHGLPRKHQRRRAELHAALLPALES